MTHLDDKYLDVSGYKIEIGDVVAFSQTRRVPLLLATVMGFKDGCPNKVDIKYNHNSVNRLINPKGLCVIRTTA